MEEYAEELIARREAEEEAIAAEDRQSEDAVEI